MNTVKRFLSLLKDPETCARAVWGGIPPYIRRTFCAAVAFGLAAHLYMFTNKFTNHDDVGSLFGNTYGAASGRWLRPFFVRLGGSASMPWLVGLLSVLCLAGVACFTVSLLRIRRPVGCLITAALLVCFPTVLSTFTYLYTAFAYFLSLFLAAFGAWAAARWKWRGCAVAVVSIMLSLSVYQSYFPVAAALMVAALLLETLDGKRTFPALLLEGLRLLGTLIAALGAYMVSVRVTTGGQLADYMGLQNMGKLSLEKLPRQIAQAYEYYAVFFWEDQYDCHFGPLKYALLLAALGTVALAAVLLWKKRLGWARAALAAALLAVFPLAAGLIYIMVPDAPVHSLMIYGFCYCLILPLALVEYAGPALPEGAPSIFHSAVSWVVMLTMALTAYSYLVSDNKTYLKVDLSLRQCEAYSTRLLERIESCEGYETWMSVILVGSNVREWSLSPTPEMGDIHLTGVVDLAGMRSTYTYAYYLRNFLGFPAPVYWGGSDEARQAAALDEVKEMPLYPSPGSIRVIQDVAVVKLN